MSQLEQRVYKRRWREWLLRLCLVILSPLLFFGLIEAGLRLGGYGYPTGFFIGHRPAGVFRTNEKFGWRFFARSLAREPVPALISTKPAGAIRIFIFGSSAAQGFPDPAFSFGRILEVMLRERYPGVRFEVVNVAMLSISSHVSLEIARDSANHQPDIFILYMGNNEVVGPYGPGNTFKKGSAFEQWSPNLRIIRGSIWARSTRVGQLVEASLAGISRRDDTSTNVHSMAWFLGNTVAADDPRLAATYRNFRQNLEDICSVARRAGASVVLSTVAVNLKDCPPITSQHRSNLLPADLRIWESLYKEGCDLEAAGKRLAATEKYEAAAHIDDRFADLQYRMGRCFASEGMLSEARARFILACDLDALRFRADRRINAIIREVATALQADGVTLADTEKSLAAVADPAKLGVPGEDLFYEHAHLNFDGNYWVARVLLDRVGDALPQLARFRKENPVLSRQQCAELVALTPLDEFKMREDILKTIISRPPFTDQLDHVARLAAETKRLNSQLQIATTPEALRAGWKTYETALAKAPDDWQLHNNFGRLAIDCGRPDVAVEQRRIVGDMIPWEPWTHRNLGRALEDLGQIDEAITQYREALRLNPDDPVAHIDLGVTLAGQGQTEEAMKQYREALRVNPCDPVALNNLGVALADQGQIDKAIMQYRETLRLNPDYAEAHNNLGNALFKQRHSDEAIAQYQEAVRLRPNYPDAHVNLGRVLHQTGKIAEAIVHYEQALRSRPGSADLHCYLGRSLLQTGKLPEAIGHYEQALRIRPENAEAHYNLAVALAQTGKLPEAIRHYTEIVRLRPDFLLALNNLAWILATNSDSKLRDGAEAVRLAEHACKMTTHEDAGLFDTLAAAYAEEGRFDDAVKAAEQALSLTRAARQEKLAAEIAARLQHYRQGQPYRESVQPKVGN